MMTGNSKPTNWMPWAIVGALLGAAFTFMIGSVFGVVGFIFSREANNAYKSGKIIDAETKNYSAKKMTLLSLTISALGIISFILYTLI